MFSLFCCFTSQVNSYGHGRIVSSPNLTFFLGKLEQAVNQYLMYILSLKTDNNPSWMIQQRGGKWPYILFHNLHESMAPARDQTRYPRSAVRLASVARHVTHCPTQPGVYGTCASCKGFKFCILIHVPQFSLAHCISCLFVCHDYSL